MFNSFDEGLPIVACGSEECDEPPSLQLCESMTGVVSRGASGLDFSKKTPPAWILRVLAVAMGAVGIRAILQAVQTIHNHPER